MLKSTMTISKAIFLFVFVFGTDASINSKFEQYLSGRQHLTDDIHQEIWEFFLENEGINSPNANLDDMSRKLIFADTVNRVLKHNIQPTRTYTKGLNKFSDMAHEHMVEYFHLDKTNGQQCSATTKKEGPNVSDAHIPEYWNWQENGGVTPVKSQNACGSCWTFSTIGALEAHMRIKYKSFVPLSEQQLVDCAGNFDTQGCDGGLPSHAFEYIADQAHGISTEIAYPYYAEDQQCSVDPRTFVLNVVGGAVNITAGDEVELAVALFEHGPVSVAFQVSEGFSDYNEGVYMSTVCENGAMDVNHAVLAVGYGHENGIPYWLVKNSWGVDWGDQGYFKIERGTNMCGIAVCNSYPKDVVKLMPSDPFNGLTAAK